MGTPAHGQDKEGPWVGRDEKGNTLYFLVQFKAVHYDLGAIEPTQAHAAAASTCAAQTAACT